MIHRLELLAARERNGRTNEALMSAAKRGDRRAFNELVSRYKADLLRFCRDELLAMSAWLAVWEQRAAYEDGRRFCTWLFGPGIKPAVDAFNAEIRRAAS